MYLPDWVLELFEKKWLREMEEKGISLEIEDTGHKPSKEELEKLIEELERKEKSCGKDSEARK